MAEGRRAECRAGSFAPVECAGRAPARLLGCAADQRRDSRAGRRAMMTVNLGSSPRNLLVARVSTGWQACVHLRTSRGERAGARALTQIPGSSRRRTFGFPRAARAHAWFRAAGESERSIAVGRDYLEVLGLRLVAGRTLEPTIMREDRRRRRQSEPCRCALAGPRRRGPGDAVRCVTVRASRSSAWSPMRSWSASIRSVPSRSRTSLSCPEPAQLQRRVVR